MRGWFETISETEPPASFTFVKVVVMRSPPCCGIVLAAKELGNRLMSAEAMCHFFFLRSDDAVVQCNQAV
jgi:hypothetical protein